MALAMALRACAPLADLGLGGARGEGGAETWSQSPSSLQSPCVEAWLKAEREIVRKGVGAGCIRGRRSCAQ